jgi:hypothetical protein
MKHIQKVLAVIVAWAIANPLFLGMATTTAVIAPSIVSQPAQAAWWDSVSGVYFVDPSGEPHYFGTYSANPNVEFQGSTWSLRCNNNGSEYVCAHGYNRSIPRAIRWLANRLGR